MNPASIRTISIMLGCLLVNAATALAQFRVVAEIESPVFAGDTASMSIRILNATEANIEVPKVDGLSIVRTPLTSQRSRDGNTWTSLGYRVQTSRAGSFEIPPIKVTANGKTVASRPLKLVVRRPQETDQMSIELEFPDRDLFVGEPVPVTVRLRFRSGLHTKLRLSIADPTLPFESYALPDPRIGLNALQQRQYHEVELLGGVAYSPLRTVRRGRTQFNELAFTRIIIPREPGTLDLGPATATANEGRARVLAESKTGALTVRALPTAGRPSTFSGLIGEYEVFATATPSEVNVGDPITLRFNVTGPEPLRLVPAIDLSKQPELTRSFKVVGDLIVPQYLTGSAAFETMIRATTDTVEAIPPIEFAYFDTVTGTYKAARSEPIPLRVRPSNRIEVPGLDDEADELIGSSRPGGIAPLVRSTDGLDASDFSAVGELTTAPVIAILAAPPAMYAACLGLLVVRHQRQRDPAGARRRRALRRATRRLGKIRTTDSQAIGAVSQAICAGVADLIDAPEAGFTGDEAVDALRERDAGSADDAQMLIRKCDAARFGGADTGSVETLRDEATSLMVRIATELKEARE